MIASKVWHERLALARMGRLARSPYKHVWFLGTRFPVQAPSCMAAMTSLDEQDPSAVAVATLITEHERNKVVTSAGAMC